MFFLDSIRLRTASRSRGSRMHGWGRQGRGGNGPKIASQSGSDRITVVQVLESSRDPSGADQYAIARATATRQGGWRSGGQGAALEMVSGGSAPGGSASPALRPGPWLPAS